jgi:hypothetical protein
VTIEYKKKCTAYHESGHLIVAAHEGFETFQIIVTVKGNGTAHTSPRLPGRSTIEYASSRLRVLFAGAVAQCIALHEGDEKCAVDAFSERGNAYHDFLKVEELARLLVHEQHNGKLDEKATATATEAIIRDHQKQTALILKNNRGILSELGYLVLHKFAELDSQDPGNLDSVAEAELPAADIQSVLDKLIR